MRTGRPTGTWISLAVFERSIGACVGIGHFPPPLPAAHLDHQGSGHRRRRCARVARKLTTVRTTTTSSVATVAAEMVRSIRRSVGALRRDISSSRGPLAAPDRSQQHADDEHPDRRRRRATIEADQVAQRLGLDAARIERRLPARSSRRNARTATPHRRPTRSVHRRLSWRSGGLAAGVRFSAGRDCISSLRAGASGLLV